MGEAQNPKTLKMKSMKINSNFCRGRRGGGQTKKTFMGGISVLSGIQH